MAICISAIAQEESEEYVVFATDHMVTVWEQWGFELDVKKYEFLDEKKNCVIMLAGNPLISKELLKDLKTNLSYTKYKTELYERFRKMRELNVKKFINQRFGIEISPDFIKQALLKPDINSTFQDCLDVIGNPTIEASIILAGIGENGECHINEINEEGFQDVTFMGFHCIGSGDLQARNVLLHSKQSKKNSVRETIYNVYKSKKYAEVSNGVGKETDIIISGRGIYKKLDKQDLKILDDLLKQESSFEGKKESLNKINYKTNKQEK